MSAAAKSKLKEAFEVEAKYGAFYTGGNVTWHEEKFYCQNSSSVSKFNTKTGTVEISIGEEGTEDADTISTFAADGKKIVTAHKSGLLKLWNDSGELSKTWKSIHKGPVARLSLKHEQVLGSGGSDGIVRVWDLEYRACILSLRGCFGVVNMVEFHPAEDFLLASGDDGKIHMWGLENGELLRSFNGHFSKVTSIAFHYDNRQFVSAGRDKVLILWDISSNSAIRTVPVYEAIESVVALPIKFKLPNIKITKDEGVYVATGGENAIVRVWDVTKSKEIFVQTNSLVSKCREGGLAITKLLYNELEKSLAVVSAEQNIMIYSLKTFDCKKQFVGFTDEILDLVFVGKGDTYLAVATNSSDIKLYNNSNMNCDLLKGHTDLVLGLCKSNSNPNLIMSSSKDNSVRIWLLDADDGVMSCVGIGIRHTGSVGTINFSNVSTKFAVSGSQDTCLKMWEIPANLDRTRQANLICSRTTIAHQKDINSVAVSPNDKLLATASQDKTAKLWSDSLELLGVFRGHKRGVWCVRFSPIDQVLLSSSADCTVKLWSITELNCLKTIEGHEASVLRSEFITNGMQILTVGADGLIKVFNLKSSECQVTLDRHVARVWAVAVREDETGFVTGGSDSVLIKWKDVTQEKRLQEIERREELTLQEQKLCNYIQSDRYLKALRLALRLEKPYQVLQIVNGVVKKGEAGGLPETVKQLKPEEKESLLKCAIDWNTNSRNCHAAQSVLNILLNELQGGEFRPSGLSKTIESALPYTERHFRRLTQTLQDLHFISYTINCMQPYAK